jgi:hypothetical protein
VQSRPGFADLPAPGAMCIMMGFENQEIILCEETGGNRPWAEVDWTEVVGTLRAQYAFLLVPQGAKRSHPLPLVSISYGFPLGCHGRGQHSRWTNSRLVGQVTKRPMPLADLIANDNGQYHVVANLRSGTTTELKGHASVCPMSVIRERFCNLP